VTEKSSSQITDSPTIPVGRVSGDPRSLIDPIDQISNESLKITGKVFHPLGTSKNDTRYSHIDYDLITLDETHKVARK
jgi:hypothetical protein